MPPSLNQLNRLLTKLQYQFEFVNNTFQERLIDDFRLVQFPDVLLQWHTMPYNHFKQELDVLLQKQLLSTCLVRDWEEYFHLMQNNYKKLEKDITDTKSEIQTLNRN